MFEIMLSFVLWLNKPVTHREVLSIAIAYLVVRWWRRAFNNGNSNVNPIKRATYNPKEFRGRRDKFR